MRVAPPGPLAFAVAGVALAAALLVGIVAIAGGGTAAVVAALVAAALLSLAGGLIVQERSRRPLRRLSGDIRHLGDGDQPGPARVGADQDLAALAGAVNDLAATLRGQIAVARGERERLDQALAAAADVVIAVDGAANVVYANEAAGTVLSGEAQAALGRPLLRALRDHEVHALVTQALGSDANTAAALIRRDDRHYQAVARPLRGDGQWEAVLIMHDVSAAQQAEQTRREFVANVSHELRTPLATISAATETLERGVDAADSQRFHRMIHQETDKMAQLVEEMLDLARLESGLAQPQRLPMDVRVVAQSALDRVRPQADRAGLTLALRTPASITVEADADLVQRALGNLLHNALKFTPGPGDVTLEAREEGGAVWLLVRDTGIGISADDRERVFQRFYRADWARRRGEGTGLGLALVRHIAESHGGTVRVDSEPGEGSTFGFSLPRETP
ncbi:MAG: ATP-binding protein [Chloroflexota bacterium]|nr:ATP-binding protein [Chloroflexota bacterium]